MNTNMLNAKMRLKFVSNLLLCCAAAMLAGCGASSSMTPAVVQGAAIKGVVHGGQQPIKNAKVYLLAAGTTGYGMASTSLLKAADTGNAADSIGSYVLTDNDGNFSITGDYTCTANTQVYLYALGGNPGAGDNTAAGLLAVLGNCPTSGSLATQTPTVLINEVSTIAAAYAIAGFATDATHVSSPSATDTLAATGIANAFANAGQMYDLANASGALATTPGGNGVVPQKLIHTLANILAACINSTGSTCTTVLGNALSAGTTGTTPTDTATAAINIAHNPASNVAALYGVTVPDAPFQPSWSAAGDQPNDFSITLTYSLNINIGGTDNAFAQPSGLAVDAAGNVQVASYSGGSSNGGGLLRLTPLGVASVLTRGFAVNYYGVAIDPSGNSWATALVSSGGQNMLAEWSASTGQYNGGVVTNYADKTLPAIDGNGVYFLGAGENYIFYNDSVQGPVNVGIIGGGLSNPYASAVDTNNYSWTTSHGGTSGNVTLFKLLNSTTSTGCGSSNYASGSGVAIDRGNNAWVSDDSTGYLIEFANACSYTTSFTPSSSTPLVGLAFDGSNRIWTLGTNNKLYGVTTGNVASTGSGLITGATGTQLGPVVDGSGNVWFSNSSNNTVSETIGVATPVITPLAAAVKAKTMGTKP